MTSIHPSQLLFLLPLILCLSCSEGSKVRVSELQKESPEIAAWAERSHADVIAILPIKTPSKFSQEELTAVEKFIDANPHSFSFAKDALSKKSDDLWYDVILNGNNNVLTSFVPIADLDINALSKMIKLAKPIKVWIVMIKRSNNYFGDRDTFLGIISLDGHPLAYGYFGVKAGSPDSMIKTGLYVPPNKSSLEPNPVKRLDDLPVPRAAPLP